MLKSNEMKAAPKAILESREVEANDQGVVFLQAILNVFIYKGFAEQNMIASAL